MNKIEIGYHYDCCIKRSLLLYRECAYVDIDMIRFHWRVRPDLSVLNNNQYMYICVWIWIYG